MEQVPRQAARSHGGKAAKRDEPRWGHHPATLVMCLTALSFLTAAAGVAGALLVLAQRGLAGIDITSVLRAAACVLSGLAAGAALWAMSWLVRAQYALLVLQRRTLSSRAEGQTPAPPTEPSIVEAQLAPEATDASAVPATAELLRAVLDLNANLMLAPDERQAKRRKEQEEKGRLLVEQARAAIARDDFPEAARVLRQLGEEFPADPRAGELDSALTRARDAAKDRDVEQARHKARDLMALAKFDEAREVARHLVAAHPHVAEAASLLADVDREADAFTAEQRRRMYADLERQVGQRQWRQAVVTARLFLERFPASEAAKIVAMQIGTLEENATIEEVRDLRDRIRDLLERRRYAEALQVAQDVIGRFPNTAVAAELAQQLPRLTKRARGKK